MLDQLKRLGKHSTVYGLSNALSASIALVLLPILTRYLAPGDYGALELVIVFAAQLGIVLQLGIGSAVFKFVLQGSTDTDTRGRVLATAYYTVAAFSLTITAVLLFFSGPLAVMLLGDAGYVGLIAWVLIKGCFEAITVVPMARLRMREESWKYGALSVGRLLLSVVVFYTILAVFHGGLPALVVALGAESVLFALVASATAAADLGKGYSRTALRPMLSFGLPLVPFALGLTALALGDRYFLRFFSGLEDVGRYTVGYKVAATLGIAIRAFQVAWPTVLFSAAERPNAQRLYSRLLTYLVFLLASAGLIVSVFARELVAILAGSAFHSAYVVVPILVLAQLGLGVFYVTAVGSNLTGKTHYQTMAVATALAVFVSLSFLLIPAFGMVGAAIATASGYAVLAGASCALSLRVYPIAYEWRRVAIVLATGATLGAIGFATDTGNLGLDLVLKTTLVALYPVLLYVLGLADESERDFLRNLLLRSLARVLLPGRAAAPDPARVKSVLVYGGMGIGNMIMYTPALRVLREGLPNAHITLLTGSSGADQVLAGGDLVDEIVRAGAGTATRLRLAFRLRRRGYQVLLSAFQGDAFKLVTLLTGIPYRIGHCSSGGWNGRADFLYNIPVRMEEDEHEVDRKLRLPRALGLPEGAHGPEFFIGPGDRASALTLLESAGLAKTELLIGLPVDVSRGQEWKRWSPERLATVCNELHRRHGCEFVLLGAPDRKEDASALVTLLAFEPFVALGSCSLKETAAILERCALTICADSGLMHVSAAVGTPALAIYGPTDYRRTSPTRYDNRHRVVRKEVECGPCFKMEGDAVVRACSHRKCLGLIQSDELVETAEEMLGLRPANAAIAFQRAVETSAAR